MYQIVQFKGGQLRYFFVINPTYELNLIDISVQQVWHEKDNKSRIRVCLNLLKVLLHFYLFYTAI